MFIIFLEYLFGYGQKVLGEIADGASLWVYIFIPVLFVFIEGFCSWVTDKSNENTEEILLYFRVYVLRKFNQECKRFRHMDWFNKRALEEFLEDFQAGELDKLSPEASEKEANRLIEERMLKQVYSRM